MKYFIRSIFFIFLIATNLAYADPASDLVSLLNPVQSMQANFEQTTYDNHGKAIQKSYGHIALQRPGKFRWEVTKPMPQIIVANQTRLWIYDPDLQQMTIRSLDQAASDAPALLLSQVSDEMLNKDYDVKIGKKNSPSAAWFLLVPHRKDNMFATIEMKFTNKQINEMVLQDHLGHITRIQFSNAKYNIALSSHLFNLHPPKHVDVIDETSRR